MARIARRGNVRAIRPGIVIPPARDEDVTAGTLARVARASLDRAYNLAQTEPNSEAHQIALHVARIDETLPRNNLRLIVNPPSPQQHWFDDACQRVRIATAAVELVNSQWAHAYHLDRWDQGSRADSYAADRKRLEKERDVAILDALRTPTFKKRDAARKQEMIGKREWAAKYRPDWQAIVDEDLGRYPSKGGRSGDSTGQAAAPSRKKGC